MNEVIPLNSATAAYRRVYFTLVDATDLVTPEDIVVTGVKVTLSFNGTAPAASTNDIVEVNGTNGEYYIELTQTEANTGLGNVRGWLTPAGCALSKVQGTIVTDDVYAAGLTKAQIALETMQQDFTASSGIAGSVGAKIGGQVAEILTTALTESYAADGAAGTLTQILYALQGFMQEKVISGTTLTIKKLDGSTTAMVFTLNSATAPTSVTRAS